MPDLRNIVLEGLLICAASSGMTAAAGDDM